MSQHREHRDRITDEAALWFARAQDPEFSAADRKALADWLAGSAEHVREYLSLAALAGEIGELEGMDSIEELIERSRSEGDGVNVVPLSGAAQGKDWSSVPVSRAGGLDRQDSGGELLQQGGNRSRPRLRKGGGLLQRTGRAGRVHRRVPWMVAAALVLGVGIAALLVLQSIGPETYSTGLGEQRSVRLDDGSVVTLNAQSTIEVALGAERRDIVLISGEVLFDVERDPSRPFQVLAEGTTIRAIGTAFNVRHRGEDTTVTVVEGTVEVESQVQMPRRGKVASVDEQEAVAEAMRRVQVQPVRVTVGQQARVEAKSGQVAIIDTNVSKATAWRQRRLVFDAWPLSKVIAEFNLYNERPIMISNRELAQRPISGAFDADDRESFTLFLEEAGIADADIRSDGIIELQQKTDLP